MVGVDSHQGHHVVVAVYSTAVHTRVPDPDPDPHAFVLELAFHDPNPAPESLDFTEEKNTCFLPTFVPTSDADPDPSITKQKQ